MDNLPKITSDENVSANWEVSTLKIFIQALSRYEELLTPCKKPKNTKIVEEIRFVNVYKKIIREWINGNGDHVLITRTLLDGHGYMLLNSVLHKYWTC